MPAVEVARRIVVTVGLLLLLALAVPLPVWLSSTVLILALAVGPTTAALLHWTGAPLSRAVVIGFCGNLALLLLGVQAMLLLDLWFPSALMVLYALSVVSVAFALENDRPVPAHRR